MEEKIKNPIEMITQAQSNYLKEWNDFSENYHKLYDYIKPFLEQNEEYKEIASKVNISLIALPVTHLVISTMQHAHTKVMLDVTRASIPPLKIECPKCKIVVWDVSKIKELLDPEGNIYDTPTSTEEK